MRYLEHVTIGILGGLLYVGVELLFRGRSHPSMFVVGGLCFWLIGMLDRAAPGLPLLAQMVLGAAAVTGLELLSGLLVNVRLGWDVWDYSALPLNYRGQICLPFSLLWLPLSLAAIFADDALRLLLFHRAPPPYRWVL